jgi:aspartate beta-hydroxylase
MDLYESAVQLLRLVYAGTKTSSVLDAETIFPEHHDLLAALSDIRQEALALCSTVDALPRLEELRSSQASISNHDGKEWRLCLIKVYRHVIRSNSGKFPTVERFLDHHPKVISAVLSVIAPGKHIPAHKGPLRGIARFHLCLYARAGADTWPHLVLDGNLHPFYEGSWLLWDDTFEHEVLNPTLHPRVVLILDIRRQDLPFFLRLLTQFILGVLYVYAFVLEQRLTRRSVKRQR